MTEESVPEVRDGVLSHVRVALTTVTVSLSLICSLVYETVV